MIRLLIVERARLMCDALAAVLGAEPDVEVVGFATDIHQALLRIDACNMVLVSAALRDGQALKLARTVARSSPGTRVVATAMSEDAVLPYVEAGVAGYVLKEESVESLLEGLHAANEGVPHVSPRVAALLIARLIELVRSSARDQDADARIACLTARERQVHDLVDQGLSNQDIAQVLAIETGTVKNHVHSILRKLNVSSRRHLSPVTGSIVAAMPAAILPSLDSIYYRQQRA